MDDSTPESISPKRPFSDYVLPGPRAPGETDALTYTELSRIQERLGSLVLDETSVLVDHQKDAFDDIVEFYRKGGRECYVQLPTGTGKTVLFVELCKRFLDSTPEGQTKSRVIVLVPSVDLVNQTVGSIDSKTGKRRGFRGFAPEIDARPHHNKVSAKQRDRNLTEADVLVTTYSMFRNLVGSFTEAESKSPEEWLEDRQEHLKNARQHRDEIGPLIYERSRFLHTSYVAQEEARALSTAQLLLLAHHEKPMLSAKELSCVEQIVSVVTNGTDPTHNVANVKKIVGSNVSEKTKIGLEKLAARVDKVKETKKRKLAQSAMRRQLGQIEEVEDDTEPVDLEDTTLGKDGLSEFENFALEFLWLNRPGRTITTDIIRDPAKRKRLHEYSEEIRDRRAMAHHATNLAAAAAHKAVVVESVDRFDLIVCDEAHRSIGSQTWDAIREYAAIKGVAILGLTATDEYPDRNLQDYFETKAHELTKEEAIRREIVNPVALFVHETGLQYDNVSLDPSGDYDRLTIRQMRHSEERNRIGIDYARLLSEHGYHGIMSAIPGDEGSHAKVLAEMLNQQTMIDPITHQTRPMRARHVLQASENRAEYYRQYEAGELDWLVYVDVLREGWDSDTAKAIINMRPTRSPLLATQRLGRIGRTNPGAHTSIAIDLYDGIRGEESSAVLPPVLAADVFDLDTVEQGYVIGTSSAEDEALFHELKDRLPYPIVAHHTRYKKVLGSLAIVDASGFVKQSESGFSAKGWATFEALQRQFEGFLPKEVVLDALESDEPQVRTLQGRTGERIVPLFNILDVRGLHNDKPEINPWRLYIDDQNVRWITPEGCVTMLAKVSPGLSPQIVSDTIRRLEEADEKAFTRSVGKVRLSYLENSDKRVGFINMYRVDEIMERLVPVLRK